MKATIEYNLPDDQIEFDLATSASKMHSVLWDLDQWLRGNTKHAPDSTHEEAIKAYYKCRDHLRELMSDNNLNFD
jgi:hypothetical protein